MELSKNFDKEMARREKPECFGTYAKTSGTDIDDYKQKKAAQKKCGMCWFAHKCKAGADFKDFGGKDTKTDVIEETTETESEKDTKKSIFKKNK